MNILVQWHYFMTLELKRMWELFIKGKCFLKKEMFSNGKFSKPCLNFYLIILSSWTFQPSSSSSSLIIICLVFKCIFHRKSMYVISSVQSLSHVQLFMTPWTAARQASLFIINSWSWLKLMFIESVMPSNHLILCRPLLLMPSVFLQHQGLFKWVSSSHQVAKVLEFQFNISPSNEHPGPISFRMDWLDLLVSPRDSRESSPTPQFKSINSSTLNFLYSPTLKSTHDYWKNHSLD